MSTFSRILSRLFGGPKRTAPTESAPAPAPTPTPARTATYDAARTGTENRNHWSNADALSARGANNPAVRFVLRNRSRHEIANNGNAKGIIRQRTHDTIGTGPRLRLELPEETYDADFQRTVAVGTPGMPPPADLARQVERKWCEWVEATHLADKLRILATAEDVDGEGVGLFVTNDMLPAVKLDLRVVECDRLATPDLFAETQTQTDGIVFDTSGNPVAYTILRTHPGDTFPGTYGASWEYDRVPASQVVHLFEQDRPEQTRGIPLLTPGLPLYALLRRSLLAELGAAELGAMIAGVIESQNALPDDTTTVTDITQLDEVAFARNALLTLPAGQTAKAFDSKNPNPDFRAFRQDVLTEAGRSAGENRNTATGSSADYNYSSGRLDHLPRNRGLVIRRERFERRLLDRAFLLWLEEAQSIPGYLPAGLPPLSEWEWCWQWDGFASIDPLKDANAVQVQKQSGQITDSQALAERGIDWREHYKQLAREKQMRAALGIEITPAPAAGSAAPDPQEAQPGA